MALEERIIEQTMRQVMSDRFGRYSKYIILHRAIPDARDGLKPVQRRILYAMLRAGNIPEKPYRKSAKSVGDVMGSYHPHGDASIYEAMVRMSQSWKMRYPLIDMHGNNGSIDDDPPAAMRYTEARLSGYAMLLLKDIDRETVPFIPNYDNTQEEPSVLPSRYPHLLVNGAQGISSGFATDIPPHNLNEVIDAAIALIEKPDLSVQDLLKVVKGPDFPTGGIIQGKEGIRQAYEMGKGKVVVRSRTQIENLPGGRRQIKVTEIPYGVVKSKLVKEIEELVLNGKLEGIQEVRDDTDREGLAVVIELKKEADPELILNYLFKKTALQLNYHFNMVAIVERTPQQVGLKTLLKEYIAHQKEIVRKRTVYDLHKAEDRLHVVEGLIRALSLLDEVIAVIRASSNRQQAAQKLQTEFAFTERQAEAILSLQFYRLTNTDVTQLEKEVGELRERIRKLSGILQSEKKLSSVICKELEEIKAAYGDARKTAIEDEVERIEIQKDKLVPSEDAVVVLTQEGYIKRSSLRSFSAAGGRIEATGLKEGDRVSTAFHTNTTHFLLLFTQDEKYFVLPVHQIPELRWKDVGTALVNLISLENGQQIVQALLVPSFAEDRFLYIVTAQGIVKKTELPAYFSNRSVALNGYKLKSPEDALCRVLLGDGRANLLLVTRNGLALCLPEDEIPAMGKNAAGIKGMSLADGDILIGAHLLPAWQAKEGGTDAGDGPGGYAVDGTIRAEEVKRAGPIAINEDGPTEKAVTSLLLITRQGVGKKVALEHLMPQNRAGKGNWLLKSRKTDPHEVCFSALVGEKVALVAESELGLSLQYQGVLPETTPGGRGTLLFHELILGDRLKYVQVVRA